MKRKVIKNKVEIPTPLLDTLKIVSDFDSVDILQVNHAIILRKSPNTAASPKQVTAITVTSTATAISLTWLPASNTTSDILYYIYKGETPNFPLILSQPFRITPLTKFFDIDLESGKTYFYKIVAADSVGHYSLPSVLVSGKTLEDDTPPAIKTDLAEKAILNKKELERQITDNQKNAEILKTRLKKMT